MNTAHRSLRRFAPTTAAILMVSAGSLFAGPLNPPAGPVTSSMKALSEVEPRTAINATNTPGDANSVFKITQAGSYYLTSNLSVGSGQVGIEIAANSVTIDLNGFVITGTTGSFHGVSTVGQPLHSITVRNGTIRQMGGNGVSLLAAVPSNFTNLNGLVIEDLVIKSCDSGISTDSGIVRNCVISDCDAWGIYGFGWTSGDVLVDGCVASNNTLDGISVGNGTVRGCLSRSNGSNGISVGNTGIIQSCHSEDNQWGYGGSRYHLIDSVAQDNALGGVYTNDASVMRGNRIHSTTLAAGTIGIKIANSGSRLEGNNVVRQSLAIKSTGANNFIVGNSISSCPTAIDAVAGNRVGTIVVGTSSPAINGNSGGGLGTTDPYANILY